MSRYIDADKRDNTSTSRIIPSKYSPTADVVEVVRCEKCRWGTITGRNYDGTLNIHCGMHNSYWFDGDFCNYGSKRSEL